MLMLAIEDVRRATLPLSSGNEGWIGVSKAGDDYHAVVPVDAQIAKGVMACNRPTDGTPFGGYVGWLYFRCEPYDDEGRKDPSDHARQVSKNAADLIEWLRWHGIQARFAHKHQIESPIVDCQAGQGANGISVPNFGSSKGPHKQADPNGGCLPGTNKRQVSVRGAVSCAGCSKSWHSIRAFLSDSTVRLDRYRAFPNDFRQGRFLFEHSCGSVIEIPTTMFVKPGSGEKSLIGAHACPGLCYHETSFRPCSAQCEGSRYRRIASHIRLKNLKRGNGGVDPGETT